MGFRLSGWQQDKPCTHLSVVWFTYINKWHLKINFYQCFPGQATEHKMLPLFYNRYKARLISCTAEVPFVQFNLIKLRTEQWKADFLNRAVKGRFSKHTSGSAYFWGRFWWQWEPIPWPHCSEKQNTLSWAAFPVALAVAWLPSKSGQLTVLTEN